MILDLGFEPVRNETGCVPYSKDVRLESSAYREVELCDIVVSIIGGRFGTESQDHAGYSISQAELKRALDRGIQVFIFIERSVLSEYSTYQLNKDYPGIKYRFVDNPKIYEFIEQIHKLPRNNPIAPFETAADITSYLKMQWAGLFQRFLQEQTRVSELQTLEELTSLARTLRELVTFLTEERQSKDEAIQNILLANHPAFRRFAELTKTPYRVFFSNRRELEAWLRNRGWNPIDNNQWDPDSIEEWVHEKFEGYIKITIDLFDETGRLKVFSQTDWNDAWVSFVPRQSTDVAPGITDDDIPF